MSLTLREWLIVSGPPDELERFERGIAIANSSAGDDIVINVGGGGKASGRLEALRREPTLLELRLVSNDRYIVHALWVMSWTFPDLLIANRATAVDDVGDGVVVVKDGHELMSVTLDDRVGPEECDHAWRTAVGLCASHAGLLPGHDPFGGR